MTEIVTGLEAWKGNEVMKNENIVPIGFGEVFASQLLDLGKLSSAYRVTSVDGGEILTCETEFGTLIYNVRLNDWERSV